MQVPEAETLDHTSLYLPHVKASDGGSCSHFLAIGNFIRDEQHDGPDRYAPAITEALRESAPLVIKHGACGLAFICRVH